MKKKLAHAAAGLLMLTIFTTAVYPQFVPTNWPAGNNYFDLHADQDRIFARIWDGQNGGRLFSTTDNGATWTQIGSADNSTDILSIIMLGNTLLAGTWNGLYVSSSGGTDWTPVTRPVLPADSAIWSMAMITTTLFAGTRGAVYKSPDSGASWIEVKTGIPANSRITSIAASGNAVFAGSDSNGVFVTTNGGTNWTAVNSGLTDKHITQLSVIGSKLFAVTLTGVFETSNNGLSWTANNFNLSGINCLATANNVIFAGTDSNGIFRSIDNGVSWSPVCSAMPAGSRIWSQVAGDNAIFAGTSAGVWRAPFDQSGSIHFTISADAAAGGSISPEGSVAVLEGCSQTFSVAPANGYRISDVLVDGVSAGAVSSYSFTNTTTNHSIFATFESAPFTISASAGSGGSISPSGTVTAPSGSSPTFAITPAAGYYIANVLIDGVSAGAVATYTFSSINRNHTIAASFSSFTVYRINCGTGASAPFTADQFYSGGSTYSVSSAITTTGVTNPAPQSVYQTERYGAMTYTLPNLTPGAAYTVRLHFAEIYQTAAGKRQFNVAINGTAVLSNYDIYAVTGARYKAVVREFTATANSSGQVVINFTNGIDNAKINGIEIIRLIPNTAPIIVTAASAVPNPVVTSSTVLSVLGDDDNGEGNLTYTWTTTGQPPAVVSFSANGTNGAKNTTATFTKAGTYSFAVTVRDGGNLTATGSVSVSVNQTLTSVVVSPSNAPVNITATQQFTAVGRDQFAANLTVPPTFSWSVNSAGSIDINGLFTAGVSVGSATITATSGSVSGTANVTVTVPNNPPTIATAASATPSPVAGTTTALSVSGADDNGETNLMYTWATTGTPPAAVTFGTNGSNNAKNTVATFTRAGSYSFLVTVRDAGNLTVTSPVTVSVNQIVTSISLSPTSAALSTGASQQFSATARDQFATSLSPQPALSWSVSGGGAMSAGGLFTAGTTAGGPYTVTATSGSISGTATVTVSANNDPCSGIIGGGSGLQGTTFGVTPAWTAGSEYCKASDGNTATYYDANQANGAYTGLDLGSAKLIGKIRFYPRSGLGSRMNGGKFQGSNTSNSSGFIDLYTISATPVVQWNEVTIPNAAAYRWVRYLAPTGGYGNIAEMEYYSTQETKYEAESATRSGGANINTNHTGYSGTGFVDGYYNSTTAQTTFTANVSSAGTCTLRLRYSAGNGASTNTGLYVNGIKIKNISCAATSNWDTWANVTETITLNAGNNTIACKAETSSSGCINIDYITVSK